MRYISTRGKAPVLDFAGVLLAGLRRGRRPVHAGGLAALLSADWRAMRGLCYPDLAARVMCPFAGESIPFETLKKICRDACTPISVIQPSCPGATRNPPVHAGAVPRADAGLQGHGVAGAWPLFDHVLTERDARVTIVGATSGDTGSAAIEACAGASVSTSSSCIRTTHQPRAAPPDDDRASSRTSATSRSRARSTIVRTWSRHCSPSFVPHRNISRGQLHQLGSDRGANSGPCLMPARGSAQPIEKSPFPFPPATSATSCRDGPRAGWGCRSRDLLSARTVMISLRDFSERTICRSSRSTVAVAIDGYPGQFELRTFIVRTTGSRPGRHQPRHARVSRIRTDDGARYGRHRVRGCFMASGWTIPARRGNPPAARYDRLSR